VAIRPNRLEGIVARASHRGTGPGAAHQADAISAKTHGEYHRSDQEPSERAPVALPRRPERLGTGTFHEGFSNYEALDEVKLSRDPPQPEPPPGAAARRLGPSACRNPCPTQGSPAAIAPGAPRGSSSRGAVRS